MFSRVLTFATCFIAIPLFSLAQASLTITAPSGSDEVKFGETIDISWVNGDLQGDDRFFIYYSNDGATFQNFAAPYHSQLTNSGDTSSYTWTIPDFAADSASQFRIRVWNQMQDVADTSTAFRVYWQPSVQMILPNGTEEVKFGDTLKISWLNQDMIGDDRFFIYYSNDGATFQNFAAPYHSQLINSGDTSSYSWIIPDFAADSASQFRIRVFNQIRNVSDTSTAFRIYWEPEVDIVLPNGSEEVKFGETLKISWLNGDLIGNDRFFLYYSNDGGAFTYINAPYHSQLTNSGDTSTYNWTIPDFGADSASQFRIRVFNQTRSVSDTSVEYRVYWEPEVDIVLPNGSEEVKFGETLKISWLNGDLIGNDRFFLYYSNDGGAFTYINAPYHSQLTNSGDTSTYNWTIPDFGADSASQFRIRVFNQTRSVSDTSVEYRVYWEPEVDIIKPAAGDFVLQGSTQQISWINNDMMGNDRFFLYYSVDEGAFTYINAPYYSQLEKNGDTVVYNWNTPTLVNPNASAKIRVLNQNRNIADTTLSFVLCSACPALAVYYPNGGEVLAVGSTTEIGWSLAASTTWAASDNIRIELSTNGGSTFEATAIYDGPYSEITSNKIAWVVPNLLTTSAIIRVSNTTQEVSDESNATFTIVTPPSAPTDLFAQENQDGTITLSWTDNSTNETSYAIEYAIDNNNWLAYSGALAADITTYNTGFISANTAYWWRVVAVSSTLRTPSISRYAGNFMPPGHALSFDGTDDRIVLDSATAFNFGTTDFTMEAWFSVADLSASRVILSDFNGTVSGSMGVYVQTNGAVAAYIGSNTPDLITTTGSVLVDEWYHLALVRSADSAYLYLNGKEEAATSGLAARSLQSATPMTIGQQPSGSSFNFLGAIDEVRFWNIARSKTELLDHMLMELVGNEADLLAYYRFDQTGTSGMLPDRTTNNIKGSWFGDGGPNAQPSWIVSGAFADPAPELTINTPNGGELLYGGEEFAITWEETNFLPTDSIEVHLSVNNGANYSLITSGTVADLSAAYLWTVIDSATTSALITVTNTTKMVTDTTDGTFSIQSRSLSLLSPNGGEFYEVGTEQLVSWVAEGFASTDTIQISLSADNGDNYVIISSGAHSVYSNGQFLWTVPDSVTQAALIKVANTTKSLEDVSDSVFVIGTVDRSIAINTPNGGEQFVIGETYTVDFTADGLLGSDYIDFTLSVDGGTTYPYTLAQGALSAFADTSFQWTVNQPASSEVVIRARVASYGLEDVSDEPFTIEEAPVAPIFGLLEVSIVGDTYEVRYSLDKPGQMYMVILEDGNNMPNATHVKNAGEIALVGQVAAAEFTYESETDTVVHSATATFVRQGLYDIYFTAEDEEGNLNPGVAKPNVVANYTPLERDSLVLNQLFIIMSGETWAVSEGWNDLPIESREEIVIENDRITAINLSGLGLEGALPIDITSMDALITLDISNNKVSSLPNMSGMESLTTLKVSQNNLDFGDLEGNAGLFNELAEYSPQAKVGVKDSLTFPKGSSHQLYIAMDGEQNTYQWKVDNYNTFDVSYANVVEGTSALLPVTNLDFENMGTYYAEVQNSLLPDLIIQSQPTKLWATANLTITVLAEGGLIDEGAAYALRNRGPGKAYDSIPKEVNGTGDPLGLVLTDGAAMFNNLLLGQYLIAIRANPDQYLPTYYKNTYLWEEANLFDFKGDARDTMNMFVLPPALGPDDGSGTLAGGVESDFGDDAGDGRINARRKVKRAGCSVRRFVRGGRTDQEDGEFELIAFVESDDEGRFRIEHLPAALYRFNIEYPGIPMDPDSYVEFEIGEAGSTNNIIELQATITEDGIFVERTNFLGFRKSAKDLLNVYPNPANDQVHLTFPEHYQGYLVRLINTEGRVLNVSRFTGDMGGQWTLETSALKEGLYFISVSDDLNRSLAATYRIIIQH